MIHAAARPTRTIRDFTDTELHAALDAAWARLDGAQGDPLKRAAVLGQLQWLYQEFNRRPQG